MKIPQNMLKLDLILQIINQIDHWLKESNQINERLIRWKNLDKNFWAKSKNLQLLSR